MRWARLLRLEPDDVAPLRVALPIGALIGAATASGDASVQAVFLARAGAGALPYVLLVKAVTSALAVLAAERAVRGRSPRSALARVTAGGAVATLALRAVITAGAPGASAAYALHETIGTVIQVHWGVFLLARLGARAGGRRALRTFPIAYAGVRVGAAVVGAASGWLGAAVGAANGLAVTALALGAAAWLCNKEGGAQTGPETRPAAAGDPVPETVPGTGAVPPPAPGRAASARPLLAALAVSTVALVLVRFTLRFAQQSALDTLDEASLARLLGTYIFAANLVGLVLQVALVPRLLGGLGLTRTNLLYSLATLAAQVALAVRASVPSALAARFVDDELKDALKTPASNVFYDAFAPSERARARSITLGIVSPIAHAAGAAGLAGLAALSSRHARDAIGLACAVAFVAATIAQNRLYERSAARRSPSDFPGGGTGGSLPADA